jgi:hypothetical protein
MNLEGLWKAMWANVIKNLSDLRVPGKRNLDTVAELEKQGVDHTSGLDAEALRKKLVDENDMPNAGRIREGLQSLENGGWSFEIIPKVNHLTVSAFPPEESIRRAFNVPLKGVEIRGSIAPRATYFYLTLKKQPKSSRSYYNQLHGTEEEIVAGMRRVLDGRIQTSLELDYERYLVNGKDVVGVMRNPFNEYVKKMTEFLKTIPIDAYETSDAKIIEEAKRLFRSEDGSVLLAFLDERYGLEPKAGGMDRYRKSIVEEYEKDPSMVQKVYDAMDNEKRQSVFGPDLIALFKSKSLFL